MFDATNAELVEVVNRGLVHTNQGKLINPETHSSFDPIDLQNAYRIYRFGGKVKFSLADHLKLGLELLSLHSVEYSQYWILHESFELITGLDVPRPLKAKWPWYIEHENRYLRVIYEKHGLDYSKYGEMVKEVDNHCSQIECNHFFTKPDPLIQSIHTSKTYLIGKYLELFPKEVRENAAR